MFIRLHPGKPFTRDAVEAAADRDIRIEVLADDNVIGGMTYRLDPALAQPWNARDGGRRLHPAGVGSDKDCREQGQRLADCLGIRQPVSKVCVKEIVVSLKVDDDGCC